MLAKIVVEIRSFMVFIRDPFALVACGRNIIVERNVPLLMVCVKS